MPLSSCRKNLASSPCEVADCCAVLAPRVSVITLSTTLVCDTARGRTDDEGIAIADEEDVVELRASVGDVDLTLLDVLGV